MAQNRYYSSTAVATTLVGGITSGSTTMVVAAATAYPASLPFTLILERDTANEEVVSVTGVAGTTLTVLRAQDGTAAVAHATGAVVEHGVSARDFNEPQVHIAASSAVHGIAGSVVGTTDSQVLTNKTISGANNTFTVTQSQVTGAPAGAFVGTTDSQTLTNKTLTSPTINGATLNAASTLGGVSGTTIAADHAAWTSYTPTVGGVTSPGTVVGRYLQVGKTLFFTAQVQTSATVTSANAGITFTLPNSLSGFNGATEQVCSALPSMSGGLVTSGGVASVGSLSAFVQVFCSAWVNGANVGGTTVSGVIQVA